MELIELELLDPPTSPAIFAVPIGTPAQAIDIWEWAASTPDYCCTLIAGLGGQREIQIEGRTAATVRTEITEGKWIVYDGGQFQVFDSADAALAVYKIKGQ